MCYSNYNMFATQLIVSVIFLKENNETTDDCNKKKRTLLHVLMGKTQESWQWTMMKVLFSFLMNQKITMTQINSGIFFLNQKYKFFRCGGLIFNIGKKHCFCVIAICVWGEIRHRAFPGVFTFINFSHPKCLFLC